MDEETTSARAVLSARIEHQRIDRGLTVADLAERAQVDGPQLAAVLDGTSDFGFTVLLRLAGALEVEIEDLIDGISWISGPTGGEYRADGTQAG